MPSVLVVDDEAALRQTTVMLLTQGLPDITVLEASSGASCLAAVNTHAVDVVILDLGLPDMNGKAVLDQLIETAPGVDVIILTSSNEIKDAIYCLKKGARDFLQKPFDIDVLIHTLKNCLSYKQLKKENRRLRHVVVDAQKRRQFVFGDSPAMLALEKLVDRAAPSDAAIFLQGESGTGKELLAHLIHDLSPRSKQPFVAVNCGAIPDALFESELFGYEKNAFTGATDAKLGKFEMAHGGTLFLDEIASLPVHHQVKLLRVLQEKTVDRVGGKHPIEVDVRVISAASDSLKSMMERGQFRLDLYHRINLIQIQVPALRERPEDFPLLMDYFLTKFNQKYKKQVRVETEAILKVFEYYRWPGNVRELTNVIERMVCLADDTALLTPVDLPSDLLLRPPLAYNIDSEDLEILSLNASLQKTEKTLIERALQKSAGNKAEASRLLGIDRRSLMNKLEKLGIT